MDTMNQIVASNIKRLREMNRFSLEELAKASNVSKSMLAQIERGEGNPTISTLWKIANGMGVPFDSLTVREKLDTELVSIHEIPPILEDGGKVKNYAVFPDDANRRFAVYYVEIEEGAYWNSEPHGKGSSEFMTVLKGQITVRFGEEEFTVKEGEAIRFRCDIIHSYHNSGEGQAIYHEVLYNG